MKITLNPNKRFIFFKSPVLNYFSSDFRYGYGWTLTNTSKNLSYLEIKPQKNQKKKF